jgi:arylsulfatase
LNYGLPESFDDGPDTKPNAHYAFMRDTNFVHGPIPHSNRAAWTRARNYYFNCTRDVDRHIGTVLDALGDSGLSDNTIVIYTSDHGEMATAHGMWQKGPCLYKENLGVPLIISHPDIRGGGETGSLACALDLVPTILSLTGMPDAEIAAAYPDLRGYSLRSVLERPSEPGPRDLNAGAILVSISSVYECNPDLKYKALTAQIPPGVRGSEFFRFPDDVIQWEIRSFVRGIYDGRYRFARYFSPGEHHTPTDWETLRNHNDLELYDTLVDPHEMNNLAFVPEKQKELILQLNAKLNRLTEMEVGVDDGSYMPGDSSIWKL